MKSPCTKICVIDPASGWCRGCGRTLDEIAAWATAPEDEKAAILERSSVRKQDR